jgi:hypothetical protein
MDPAIEGMVDEDGEVDPVALQDMDASCLDSTANQWTEFLADLIMKMRRMSLIFSVSGTVMACSKENVREAALNSAEQLITSKFEMKRFYFPACPKLGQYCTGKTKVAGTRYPRAV